MGLPEDNCISHVEANSDSDWLTPSIGGSWTPNNLTYNIGKFGNGSEINASSEYALKDDKGAFFNKDKFVFATWMYTNNAVTNGSISGGTNSILMQWSGNTGSGSSQSIIQFLFSTTSGFRVVFRNELNQTTIIYFTDVGLTWSASTLVHFLFVYDIDGINGGIDKVRIYINGTLTSSSTITPYSNSDTDKQLLIGANSITSTVPFNGLVDDIKWYGDNGVGNIIQDLINAIIARQHVKDFIYNLESNCISWSKREDPTCEIGGNWTQIGSPSFVPVKFGNGSYTNSLSDYFKQSENNLLRKFNKDNFAYECQIKPIGWSITNSQASDTNHNILTKYGGSDSIRIIFQVRTSDTVLFIRGTINANYICTSTDFNLADGEVGHLLLVYNKTGINGTNDKVRLYFNTNLIFSSTLNSDPGNNTGDLYSDINFYSLGPIFPFAGGIDNPKIYDDTTDETTNAINNNINNEGFPSDKVFLPINQFNGQFNKDFNRMIV